MTVTGLLLIPLGLLLIMMPWRFVLGALPSFSLMHAAAVVNVGSVGLQPGYFLALLVIGRSMVELLISSQPINRLVATRLTWMAAILPIGVCVLWVATTCFDGEVLVVGGTDAFDIDQARPYAFRRENITQLAYFVISVLLVYAVAHQAARLDAGELVRTVERGIVAALLLASVVCVWQYAAERLGFYFPDAFFQSNAGYKSAGNQKLFGGLRVNGPFSEPSALAYYFAGFLFYAWKRLRLDLDPPAVGLFLISLLILILSKSTTGYTVVMALVAAGLLELFAQAWRRWIKRFNPTTRKLIAIGLLVLGAVGLAVYYFENRTFFNNILAKTLLAKAESTSFERRMGANYMAIDVIVETGGLGLGLGSHKPSTLILTLLSNVGVIGFVAYMWFVFGVLFGRPVVRADARTDDRLSRELASMRWFLMGLLAVHAFSNPNLSVVMFWVAVGFIIGLLAKIETDAAVEPRLRASEIVQTAGMRASRAA